MTSRLSDRSTRWGKSDPLSSVLLDLRLDGTFFCNSEFANPWALDIPVRDCASFHFVARGECWFHVDTRRSRDPIRLAEGDLVLVPRSPRQVLSSSKRRSGTPIGRLPAEQLTEAASVIKLGAATGRWVVVCGGVRLEGLPAKLLLDVLPETLVLHGGGAGSVVRDVLAAMQRESLAARPGSVTLMTRLADVIVVLAIRAWLEQSDVAAGWIAALRDPQIGRAMAELHRDTERSWTVDQLARVAGFSRSRFSERFSELAGVAPMQYVTGVQMHRAQDLLKTNALTVAELASRFGYESEPAFARAFKRHIGQAPGAVRRAARRSPSP